MRANEILSIGELIVEIMRKEVDVPLDQAGDFVGPFPSGAPAIFADQAARLGHTVGFLGACGKDGFGDCLVNRFQADGVDASAVVRVEGLATGCAFVTYFADGERMFIFHIANSAAGQLPDPTADQFQGVKWLHVCGSTLSAGEEMRRKCYLACELTKAAGGKVSFDPNLRPELLGGEEALRKVCKPVMDCANLVLPSSSEAEILTGVDGADAACKALLDRGAEVVALKRGSAGCTLYASGEMVEVAAFKVDAVDPTGAGDCFDAGCVVGLLEGLPLEKVGRLANACGGLGATRKGPMEGASFRQDVDRFMAQQ
ncbi:sugar kinase [bacterium]|nr:sugar kinase [bacterium]